MTITFKLSFKQKSLLMRFVKGISSGIAAALAVMTYSQPEMWADFPILLTKVGMAAVYGAITGFILTVQKLLTWDDTLPEGTQQK